MIFAMWSLHKCPKEKYKPATYHCKTCLYHEKIPFILIIKPKQRKFQVQASSVVAIDYNLYVTAQIAQTDTYASADDNIQSGRLVQLETLIILVIYQSISLFFLIILHFKFSYVGECGIDWLTSKYNGQYFKNMAAVVDWGFPCPS